MGTHFLMGLFLSVVVSGSTCAVLLLDSTLFLKGGGVPVSKSLDEHWHVVERW